MVLPVHLGFSAVVAILDCPDRGQFIDSRSLKQAAPHPIWLFQESLLGFLAIDSRRSYLFREGLDNEGLTSTAASNCVHAIICVFFRGQCYQEFLSTKSIQKAGEELWMEFTL